MSTSRPAWTFPVAAFLGAALLRLWRLSWRVDEHLPRPVSRAPRPPRDGPGTVYCIWHSRILIGAATYAHHGLHVLISLHGDGEYIARTVERMGFRTVRGSSTRGGARALRGIVEILRRGEDVVITPDGPRGPRLRVHPGCVAAASVAGAPLVPVAFEVRTAKRLGSWDRLILPAPFTRVAIRIGAPLHVPPDLAESDVAAWCARMEEAMHAVHREAAAALGREPEPPPAP